MIAPSSRQCLSFSKPPVLRQAARLGIVDSRSNKTSNHVDTDKGIDGNKKVKGRKIHICVDILGLPLAIVIHAANIADSVGAELVFNEMIDTPPTP